MNELKNRLIDYFTRASTLKLHISNSERGTFQLGELEIILLPNCYSHSTHFRALYCNKIILLTFARTDHRRRTSDAIAIVTAATQSGSNRHPSFPPPLPLVKPRIVSGTVRYRIGPITCFVEIRPTNLTPEFNQIKKLF